MVGTARPATRSGAFGSSGCCSAHQLALAALPCRCAGGSEAAGRAARVVARQRPGVCAVCVRRSALQWVPTLAGASHAHIAACLRCRLTRGCCAQHRVRPGDPHCSFASTRRAWTQTHEGLLRLAEALLATGRDFSVAPNGHKAEGATSNFRPICMHVSPSPACVAATTRKRPSRWLPDVTAVGWTLSQAAQAVAVAEQCWPTPARVVLANTRRLLARLVVRLLACGWIAACVLADGVQLL